MTRISIFIFVITVASGFALAKPKGYSCHDLLSASVAGSQTLASRDHLSYDRKGEPYLAPTPPRPVKISHRPSPGLRNRLLDYVRKQKMVDDYKPLSDLVLRRGVAGHLREMEKQFHAIESSEGAQPALHFLLDEVFEAESPLQAAPPELVAPRWTLSPESPHFRTFQHIENTLAKLVKRTPLQSSGSLIPLPFDASTPGERFQETYYWDTYFAVLAFIRTGRLDLAKMQVENLLFLMSKFGFAPNANRDYYLTRSQIPLISQMVREVLRASMQNGKLTENLKIWLGLRVYPLLKRDYLNFWMNPNTRFDPITGLNHCYDSLNRPRPERHSADDDSRLAKTCRDTRAECEDGRDFTSACDGQAASVASVRLNTMLYVYEKDLAWMADQLGRKTEFDYFKTAAKRRKHAIDKYLWDPKRQSYFEFNLATGSRMHRLTADVFMPLWAGLASPKQARSVIEGSQKLEGPGGIIASDFESSKQWDWPFVWAPQQFFAVEGAIRYGDLKFAKRIAKKNLKLVDRVFAERGVILEKYDGVRAHAPIENHCKYKTQEGFLWTNSVYTWFLSKVLNEEFIALTR